MKLPHSRSLTISNHRKQLQATRGARAYTLIEVLAAAAIVSLGATAMVSLSATLMLQEELATRVAVTRNYQECMVRLWQLGLSPVQITALMPSQTQNAVLQQALHGTPALVQTGITNVPSNLGTFAMETARCTTAVNSSTDPLREETGGSFTVTAYRPSLITELRPATP
ncbi:MAG: prepilin-type N-terminal cleavage/methylation domain-containing protein [Prosthecobacter sp.]